MTTASPVDQQHDLMVLFIYIDDDLMNQIRTVLCFNRMSLIGAFQTAGRSDLQVNSRIGFFALFSLPAA